LRRSLHVWARSQLTDDRLVEGLATVPRRAIHQAHNASSPQGGRRADLTAPYVLPWLGLSRSQGTRAVIYTFGAHYNATIMKPGSLVAANPADFDSLLLVEPQSYAIFHMVFYTVVKSSYGETWERGAFLGPRIPIYNTRSHYIRTDSFTVNSTPPSRPKAKKRKLRLLLRTASSRPTSREPTLPRRSHPLDCRLPHAQRVLAIRDLLHDMRGTDPQFAVGMLHSHGARGGRLPLARSLCAG
jgi:hypothetical protein